MNMAELGVTVGVLSALQRLGVALQAVPGLMQEPLDQRRRHLESRSTQLSREGAQRLRRPPQRRHRVTARLGLNQGVQRLHQPRRQHLGPFTSPTRPARTAHLGRLRVIKLVTAPTYRIRRDPRSRSHNPHTAGPQLTSLRTQPHTAMTLTQMRLHMVVPADQRLRDRVHSTNDSHHAPRKLRYFATTPYPVSYTHLRAHETGR